MKSFLKRRGKSSETKISGANLKKKGHKELPNNGKNDGKETTDTEMNSEKPAGNPIICKHGKGKEKKKKSEKRLKSIFPKSEESKSDSGNLNPKNLSLQGWIQIASQKQTPCAPAENVHTRSRRQDLLKMIASNQELAKYNGIERRVLRPRSCEKKRYPPMSKSLVSSDNALAPANMRLTQEFPFQQPVFSELPKICEETTNSTLERDSHPPASDTPPGDGIVEQFKTKVESVEDKGENDETDLGIKVLDFTSDQGEINPFNNCNGTKFEDDGFYLVRTEGKFTPKEIEGNKYDRKIAELQVHADDKRDDQLAYTQQLNDSESKYDRDNLNLNKPECAEEEFKQHLDSKKCSRDEIKSCLREEESEPRITHSRLHQEKSNEEHASSELDGNDCERNSREPSNNAIEADKSSNIDNRSNISRSYHKRQLSSTCSSQHETETARSKVHNAMIGKVETTHSRYLLDFLKGNNLPLALEARKRLVTDTIESIASIELACNKCQTTESEVHSHHSPGFCSHGRSHAIHKPQSLRSENFESDYDDLGVDKPLLSQIGLITPRELQRSEYDFHYNTEETSGVAVENERNESMGLKGVHCHGRSSPISPDTENCTIVNDKPKEMVSKLQSYFSEERPIPKNVSRMERRSLETKINSPHFSDLPCKPVSSDGFLGLSKAEISQRDLPTEHEGFKNRPTHYMGGDKCSVKEFSRQDRTYDAEVTHLKLLASQDDAGSGTLTQKSPHNQCTMTVPDEISNMKRLAYPQDFWINPRQIEFVTNIIECLDIPVEYPLQRMKHSTALNPHKASGTLQRSYFEQTLGDIGDSLAENDYNTVAYTDTNIRHIPQSVIDEALIKKGNPPAIEMDQRSQRIFLTEIRDICQEILEAKMQDFQRRSAQDKGDEINFTRKYSTRESCGDTIENCPNQDGAESFESPKMHETASSLCPGDDQQSKKPNHSASSMHQPAPFALNGEAFEVIPTVKKAPSMTFREESRIHQESDFIDFELASSTKLMNSKQLHFDHSNFTTRSSLTDERNGLESKNDDDPHVIFNSHANEVEGGQIKGDLKQRVRQGSVSTSITDGDKETHYGDESDLHVEESKLKKKFSYDHWITVRNLKKIRSGTFSEEKFLKESGPLDPLEKYIDIDCGCDGRKYKSITSKSYCLSPMVNNVSTANHAAHLSHRSEMLNPESSGGIIHPFFLDGVTKGGTPKIELKVDVGEKFEKFKYSRANAFEMFANESDAQISNICQSSLDPDSKHNVNNMPSREPKMKKLRQLHPFEKTLSEDMPHRHNLSSHEGIQTSKVNLSQRSSKFQTEMQSESSQKAFSSTAETNFPQTKKNRISTNIDLRGNVAKLVCRRESKQSILNTTEGVLKVPALTENQQNVTVLFEEVLPFSKQNISEVTAKKNYEDLKWKNSTTVDVPDGRAQNRQTDFEVRKKSPVVYSVLQSPFNFQIMPPVKKRRNYNDRVVKKSSLQNVLDPFAVQNDSFKVTLPESQQSQFNSLACIESQRVTVHGETRMEGMTQENKTMCPTQVPFGLSDLHLPTPDEKWSSTKPPKLYSASNRELNLLHINQREWGGFNLVDPCKETATKISNVATSRQRLLASNGPQLIINEIYYPHSPGSKPLCRFGARSKPVNGNKSDDDYISSDNLPICNVNSRKSVASSDCSQCHNYTEESDVTTLYDSTINSKDSDLVKFFKALRLGPAKSEQDCALCTCDSSNILLKQSTSSLFHILSNVNVFNQNSRDVCIACEAAKAEEKGKQPGIPSGICNTPEKKMRKRRDSRHTVHFDPKPTFSGETSINPVQNCTSFIFQRVSEINHPDRGPARVKSEPLISMPTAQDCGKEVDRCEKSTETRVKKSSSQITTSWKDLQTLTAKESFTCCPSYDGKRKFKIKDETCTEIMGRNKLNKNDLVILPMAGCPARVYINKPGMYQLHLFLPKGKNAQGMERLK